MLTKIQDLYFSSSSLFGNALVTGWDFYGKIYVSFSACCHTDSDRENEGGTEIGSLAAKEAVFYVLISSIYS